MRKLTYIKHCLAGENKLVFWNIAIGIAYSLFLGGTGLLVTQSFELIGTSLPMAFLGAVVFRVLTEFSQGYIGNILVLKTKENLFKSLKNSMPAIKTQLSNTEILDRFSNDSQFIVENLVLAALELVSYTISLLIISGVILFKDPISLIFAPTIGFFFLILVLLLRKSSYKIHLAIEEDEERLFKQEKNYIEGHEYLMSSRRIKQKERDFSYSLKKLFKTEIKKLIFDQTTSGIVWATRLGLILVLITPFLEKFGLSKESAFWIFIFLNIFQRLTFIGFRLYSVAPVWKRNSPLLFSKRGDDRRTQASILEVKVESVELFFDSNYKFKCGALFDFKWEKGDRAWIKGESGKGKTTFIRTLMGLHDFYRGKITIPSVGKFRMGYVQQDPFFYDGESFAHNLDVQRKDALPETLLRGLGLTSLFESFDYDLSLKLGSEGILPSKGQKVRLAIFRELLKSPDVLFIDEPTSGLDEENSCMILALLKKLSKDKIVVLSEHSSFVKEYFSPTVVHDLDKTNLELRGDKLTVLDNES